jgi:uncharacterized protein with LGFP repeats
MLPQWGAIENKYRSMGAQGSFLRASTTPIKLVADNRGSYVLYQGGVIYYTSATRAHPIRSAIKSVHDSMGGVHGVLGYPTADQQTGLPDSGWLQQFEHGCLVDSASTYVKSVWGTRWAICRREGRETGTLGYPTDNVVSPSAGTWTQTFQRGAIAQVSGQAACAVWGTRWVMWRDAGRESGELGYPVSDVVSPSPGRWTQEFQNGAIAGTPGSGAYLVDGVMWPAWQAAGEHDGVLGGPVGALTIRSGGLSQDFERGQLWALGSGAARRVYGAVLTQWQAAGGSTGTYGYPLTDTNPTGDGRLTCTFEGGTITA